MSHFNWRMNCCLSSGVLSLCYCGGIKHSKSHPQRPGVAVGNPGLVCSVQKHTQGAAAPGTGIWKQG